MTTDWNDLTEDQKAAINEAAYDSCVDRLRRADAEFPGCELADLRRYCAEIIAADIAENNRIIRRAARSRATKRDTAWAASAKARNENLNHEAQFIWDAEF
jgi:hypothetical protein